MINSRTLDYYTKDKFCKIFYIQTVNATKIERDIHRHDFFQIILLNKGSMNHWIDFEAKEVKAPYISVVFPKQVHKMDLSDDAEADIIMFDETVFCSAILSNELKEYNIDLQNRLNHIVEIPEEEWTAIQGLKSNIRNLMANINMVKKMEIKFMIKIILLKAIDIAPQSYNIGNIDSDLLIYQRFREKVDQEFASQKKVFYYADQIGISSKKLTAVCYKYTGHSPLEIIHEKLSVELKKAFVEEGLLLKEIAFRFGFSSQSALNKFIERYYGCSPQVWRAKLEKNMMGKTDQSL